jgi:hypothetical protein
MYRRGFQDKFGRIRYEDMWRGNVAEIPRAFPGNEKKPPRSVRPPKRRAEVINFCTGKKFKNAQKT